MMQNSKGSHKNAKVYVKVMPSHPMCWEHLKLLNNKKIVYIRRLQDFQRGYEDRQPVYWQFETDGVFYNNTQNQIYETVTAGDLIDNVIEGNDAVIVAFGPTGSGKTLTINGLHNSFKKMNTNCIICSDLFTPIAEIFTTPCGHLFHYHCLIQWLERSHTCPQCRKKSTEKNIHRIYFNLANTDSIMDDVGTLQAKVDNLQFQLMLKDKDISNYKEKYSKVNAQNTGLREEVRNLEKSAVTYESTLHALKQQILYYKEKVKDYNLIKESLKESKNKLKLMEDMQALCNSSMEEVNEMLSTHREPKALALMITFLKKELSSLSKTNSSLTSKLNTAKYELNAHKQEVSDLKLEQLKLIQSLEKHKDCEREKSVLKRKLNDVKMKLPSANDASLNRIIAESPVCIRKEISDKDTASHDESLSVPERVKAIKDSQSPYLNLKANALDVQNLPFKTSVPFSIFRKRNLDMDGKKPKENYTYDGLGGHSKEEKFPTPNRSGTIVKRAKSSSSLPSKKFKKLAPNVKNIN